LKGGKKESQRRFFFAKGEERTRREAVCKKYPIRNSLSLDEKGMRGGEPLSRSENTTNERIKSRKGEGKMKRSRGLFFTVVGKGKSPKRSPPEQKIVYLEGCYRRGGTT